ncbi:MAG: hydrogenase maturation nickel metallochaperone HypA [Parcubacteria group bacterium]|nr:hydrogenase maturation nickel metallochaperone HypA [Parcubacteria group bacterium]
MHDLHAADKIVRDIKKYVQKNNLKKVTNIKIGLGKISEHGETISSSNLKFNIKLLSKGTALGGSKVVIDKMAGPYIKIKEIEGM